MYPTNEQIHDAVKAEGGKLYGDNMVVMTRAQLARYTDAILAKFGNRVEVEVDQCPRNCKNQIRASDEVVKTIQRYAENIAEGGFSVRTPEESKLTQDCKHFPKFHTDDLFS